MNLFKSLYIKIFFLLVSIDTFAQSSAIQGWGRKLHREGTTIGTSWLLGGFTVCAVLAIVTSSQMAYGMLSRLLVASCILFGAGTIVSFLQNVIS